MEGFFLHYEFGGLIFGGAYTLRGLFSDFYDIIQRCRDSNSKQVFDYNVKKYLIYFGHLQSYALTLSSTSLPSKS